MGRPWRGDSSRCCRWGDALHSSDSSTSASMPTATRSESASVSRRQGKTCLGAAIDESVGRRVQGWIAYGGPPGDLGSRPHASRRRPLRPHPVEYQPGEPFGWSRDGSKLLILRWPSEEGKNRPGLLVLNADGSETMVLRAPWVIFSASLSPMGPRSRTRAVPALRRRVGGGKPAHAPPRPASVVLLEKAFFPTLVFDPTFSPDGRKIAYFDGFAHRRVEEIA